VPSWVTFIKTDSSSGKYILIRIGVAYVRIVERRWSISCFIVLWLEIFGLLCLLCLEYFGLCSNVGLLARKVPNHRSVKVICFIKYMARKE
jgi:hypothetical protein